MVRKRIFNWAAFVAVAVWFVVSIVATWQIRPQWDAIVKSDKEAEEYRFQRKVENIIEQSGIESRIGGLEIEARSADSRLDRLDKKFPEKKKKAKEHDISIQWVSYP